MDAAPRLELWECCQCGFQWSDLELAGNDEFYADLHRQLPAYYPNDCNAFRRAIRFARDQRLRQVMDVGCGSGFFLDLARTAGLETFGLELNPKGAEEARLKGHNVEACLADDYLAKYQRQFDLVTAFEVVEHVPDPAGFVRQLRSLAKPGGCVAIAVPYRAGLHRLCPLEPQQWPPHHVTRWRKRDLRQLASACDLEIIQTGGDTLIGGEIQQFIELQAGFLRATGRPVAHWKTRLWKAATLLYRKTGCKYVFPKLGLGIHAFYRRPLEPRPAASKP